MLPTRRRGLMPAPFRRTALAALLCALFALLMPLLSVAPAFAQAPPGPVGQATPAPEATATPTAAASGGQSAPTEGVATEATPAPASDLPEVNTGDTAWMLVSAALVMFMTPGLALFYGGMVRSKNILNVLMQSFVALSVVTLVWFMVGYSLAFGTGGPFIGGTDYIALKGVGQTTFELNGTKYTFPHQVWMIYQLMFAIITPALISGAIADRMKFGAYVAFISIWSILIYSPMAHMVWGPDGFLFAKGALDFAGGTVVHILSGISALVLCILLGKRKIDRGEDVRPHNLPMTLIGTGILWFGWFGFNAGSAGASGGLAGSAFVVTHIAAATAGAVWILIERVVIKKPTALGWATGAVAGLVAITPAAGFVSAGAAVIIGAVVSIISYAMIQVKAKAGYDDTLDVFAVHCCGGIWGALATGLFADPEVNSVVKPEAAGVFAGGGFGLFGTQILGVVVALVLGGVGTFVIASVLKLVFGGIRATDQDEIAGLDLSQHGEEGYAGPNAGASVFGDGVGMGHGATTTSTVYTAEATR